MVPIKTQTLVIWAKNMKKKMLTAGYRTGAFSVSLNASCSSLPLNHSCPKMCGKTNRHTFVFVLFCFYFVTFWPSLPWRHRLTLSTTHFNDDSPLRTLPQYITEVNSTTEAKFLSNQYDQPIRILNTCAMHQILKHSLALLMHHSSIQDWTRCSRKPVWNKTNNTA